MPSIEYSATEDSPTFSGPMPLLVWEVDGVSGGTYWVSPDDSYVIKVDWVASGSAFTKNARRALGIAKVTITEELFDFLTDDGNPYFFYVRTPKP